LVFYIAVGHCTLKKGVFIMKRIYGIILVAVFLCISSYAAAEGGKDYTALAKEKSFESVFPVPSKSYYFDDLDSAYEFVNIAQARFTLSSGKSKAKGLAAKLTGPAVANKQPVTISYFMAATDGKSEIDLTKINVPLEKAIKNAISATLVFLVYYKDRGVSISNFHLASGYMYNSNSQYSAFTYNNKEYKAEYPIGWGVDKAFSYLKKEID